MNTQGIILHMISVVEDYIYKMKGVRVSINPVVIFFSQDQLDKLIDAFNPFDPAAPPGMNPMRVGQPARLDSHGPA